MYIRAYVRPHIFSDFNEIRYADRCVLHDGMAYDPIQGQGQGHGSLKVVKMADFKVCRISRYACDQNTNGEL